MSEKDNFLLFIETAINQLQTQKENSEKLDVNQSIVELNSEVINHCEIIKKLVINSQLSINYIKKFQTDINQTLQCFPYKTYINFQIQSGQNKESFKKNIEAQENRLKKQLDLLKFNLDFFKKLDFFNHNIVAIGANGSGKTSLSNKLNDYIKEHGVVISAQRILLIPILDAVNNPDSTAKSLKGIQVSNKSNKNTNEILQLQSEFEIVLKHLLANNNDVSNKYRIDAIESTKTQKPISEPPITNLDKAFEIWNSLLEHRKLICTDGINVNVEFEGDKYPLMQMSDGEKVMLFLIAQVLQAPKDGFIIIDEPEMYLHKTILQKLWDILEIERQDCIFVYLTHDLDFATSRTTAKKIWIKSFTYPLGWEIENIPQNELPEPLLLELLGSRKNILFCEGKKGSIDEKIYSIMFPNFTVTPVENCFAVINYTKTFNKIPNSIVKSIWYN